MRLGQQFRFNNRCKTCKHKFSVFVTSVHVPGSRHGYDYQDEDGNIFAADPSGSTNLRYECPGCGAVKFASMVLGKYNPSKECNAKCQAATGHQCECSCGGKNHGVSNEG